jgi:MarR family transcriptional regulator, organic hydroperoxide resistance regulator
MDDKRPEPRKGRRGSLISLTEKARPPAPAHNGHATATDRGDDFWPVLVEFALSLRGWWIGICDDLGLTPMQGHALRSLDPDRPSPMSVLADMLICDASNVTAIVDKLESRGLIVRQGAENDRRIKMLAVTPKGRELRESLCARFTIPPTAVESMPPTARRELADLLRAILSERTAAATGG